MHYIRHKTDHHIHKTFNSQAWINCLIIVKFYVHGSMGVLQSWYLAYRLVSHCFFHELSYNLDAPFLSLFSMSFVVPAAVICLQGCIKLVYVVSSLNSTQCQLNINLNYWAWYYSAQACYSILPSKYEKTKLIRLKILSLTF